MTTTPQQDEFIQALDGELTAEQAAQLLELAEMGDTGNLPDAGGEPDATPGDDDSSQNAGAAGNDQPNSEAQAEPEIDPANAVILAKDRKHTIPYDKLVAAREAEQQAREAARIAEAQVAQMRSQMAELTEQLKAAAARADAGQVATPQQQHDLEVAAEAAGVSLDVFGDFSEEALAQGVAVVAEKMANQIVEKKMAAFEQKMAPVLQSLQAKQNESAATAHYEAIYAAHPDADSLAESQELSDWIASQPSFVRDAYAGVLQQGTTQQVIELFDRFKQATGATQQPASTAPNPDAARDAAKAAIAKAQAPLPASLSDFPGGRAAAPSKAEALASMEAPDMLAAMQDMAPEQIEELLNRLG